mmetsp:Transcript_26156/g.82765  ORF Transcript_26156/g.82765 Transcript_26156/m.82765 type:complete len:202 (+) Transcript_26156:325-930(+)
MEDDDHRVRVGPAPRPSVLHEPQEAAVVQAMLARTHGPRQCAAGARVVQHDAVVAEQPVELGGAEPAATGRAVLLEDLASEQAAPLVQAPGLAVGHGRGLALLRRHGAGAQDSGSHGAELAHLQAGEGRQRAAERARSPPATEAGLQPFRPFQPFRPLRPFWPLRPFRPFLGARPPKLSSSCLRPHGAGVPAGDVYCLLRL